MAYSVDNPPALITQNIGGGHKLWSYKSTDAATAVRVDGYITNARDLGMSVGDLVMVVDTDASPIAMQMMLVTVINANGSGDLSDGLAVTATNTD